jgi:formate hydrogenlyase transcriptional activator
MRGGQLNEEALSSLVTMFRAVSVDSDPITSTRLFLDTIIKYYGDMGLISIGTRNAPAGSYRLTRLLHQPGIAGNEFKDLDYLAADAPVHSEGILAEVSKMRAPGRLAVESIHNDPVLGTQMSPYRSFIVLPIITLGEIGGFVLQCSTDPDAFTDDMIVDRFMTANFLGFIALAKKTAMELDVAKKQNERLKEHQAYLSEEVALEHSFEGIVFKSVAFKQVLRKLEQVAQTDATVLILGESGTGKELLAHAIHKISRRNQAPLVKVNCAALPDNLIESELFGHEKGAFTGAVKDKTGRFELADGGTIFLDEVGEIPLALQAKLLRVLQEGELERIGEERTRKVDVRVIAATNRNLEKEIVDGTFREDLYYRLNVFPLVSPPLRDRKEDIPVLALEFLSKCNATMRKSVQNISTETMRFLQSYDWPGNVRELQNIIERAVIVSDGSTLEITPELGYAFGAESSKNEPQTLHENEEQFLRIVLEECDWRIQGPNGAAAKLGLSPSTLRSRMNRLGMTRP